MSAFADPEIIRMCTDDYVPVSGDDWYQRRRDDTEGDFFRKLANAAGKRGDGGATRQGIYLFAADGTLLGYKNAGQDAAVMREVLRQGLAEFRKLPAARRNPGAVTVAPPEKVDAKFTRTPPEGGLVLSVYARILDFENDAYRKGTCQATGGDKAARDHLWITADELKQLAPAKAVVGSRYPVPEKVAKRICRFHLLDNTRGEPAAWSREQVRARRFTLKVVSVDTEAIGLRLEGEAVMMTDADPAKAERGFEVRLRGELRYLPVKKTFDRFDVVAVGSHWGDVSHTQKARPGKSLLGISLELAGPRPADKIPPQGARNLDSYFGRD